MTIKVLIADDHQLFLDGMKALLEKDSDIEVVGEALNGEEILKILETLSVDIVVSDIEMPKLDGVEATKLIRQKYPKIKVIIVSMFNKKDFIVNLMKHGASGYILKNKTKEELLNAIHNVYNGKTHYSLEILDTATSINEDYYKKDTLTSREIEILCKIAEGYNYKEISNMLFISEATVNTHRRNIFSKLNLKNPVQLARYAIKHGYVKL